MQNIITFFRHFVINLLLSGFKVTVGLLSNSISIISDAVNNLTDAMSSLML
ncbi:cation transporter [Candidatus Saccharibacteria bacterium]|nr:cation transporter [Candidatus Saccharibacteria bacterium]